MQVKIRSVLDADSRVDTLKLKPLEKIILAIRDWWRDTSEYQKRRDKALDKQNRERIEEEENLKADLLSQISDKLGKTLKITEFAPPVKCTAVVLVVDREKEEILRRIKDHSEFLSYDIVIHEEAGSDLLKAFPKMPIRVTVREKFLGDGAHVQESISRIIP